MGRSLSFKYVHVRNFLSYSDVKMTLDNRGLVYVSGQNKDDNNKSNGAGKSTLFCDALTWCLFGKLIRDIPVGKIANRFNRSQCSVEVLFYIETNKYLIRRTRRPDEPLIFEINDEDKARGDSRDTTKDIIKLLGMGFTEFINSILFGQNIQKYFFLLTDAKQKDMLDGIINIGEIMDMYKKASTGQRDKAIEMQEIKTRKLGELSNLIDLCRHRIRDYDEKGENYVKQEQERIDNAYGNISRHLALLEGNIGKIKNRLLELGEVEGLADMEATFQELLNGRFKLTHLIDTTKQVVNRESELDIVAGDLVLQNPSETRSESEIEAAFTILTEEIISLQSSMQSKYEMGRQYQDKMQSVTSMQNTDCPTCGRLVDSTCVDAVTKAYNEMVENVKVEAKDVKERLDKINEQKRLLEVAKEDRKNLKLFSEVKAAKDDVTKYESMFKVIDEQYKQTHGKLEVLRLRQKEIDELNTQLAPLQKDKEVSIQRQTELKEERKKAEEDPYQELKTQELENISNYETQIKKTELEIDIFMQYVEACKYWEKAFGDKDGIKSYIYDKVFPFLNFRCNHYLSILSGNQITAELGLDSKGRFIVSTENRIGADVYGGNSGGEKRRIDMSIMLALHDLVASRKHRSNILILDEIFDNLDVAGIDSAMALLDDISSDYSSIFVISHTDFKEYFDNQISIVKDNNCSIVVD